MTFLVFLTSAWRRYDPTEGVIYWATAIVDIIALLVYGNTH